MAVKATAQDALRQRPHHRPHTRLWLSLARAFRGELRCPKGPVLVARMAGPGYRRSTRASATME
jgi:hypothetical protein